MAAVFPQPAGKISDISMRSAPLPALRPQTLRMPAQAMRSQTVTGETPAQSNLRVDASAAHGEPTMRNNDTARPAAQVAHRSPQPPALSPRPSGGFSLIELLLVIALIAVIGVLAATALSGGMGGIRLRAAAKEIAAQLRFTRAQAIATGRPQRFSIDPRAHAWTAPRDRSGDIPPQLGIVFTGARETQPARGVGAIVFFADGASTGGRIQLNARQAAWNVDVAWLTGEVRLHRGDGTR